MSETRVRIETSGVEWPRAYEGHQIAMEYVNLPELPLRTPVVMHGIEIYNYDLETRKTGRLIQFGALVEIDLHTYTPKDDPRLGYAMNDFVTPVSIVSMRGVRFRVPDSLWFALLHASIAIQERSKAGILVLPLVLTFDLPHNAQWLEKLSARVGVSYIRSGTGEPFAVFNRLREWDGGLAESCESIFEP